MPSHKNIVFSQLHKAKLASDSDINVPLAPEGVGDVFWAPESNNLYLSNAAGDDWTVVPLGTTQEPVIDKLNDIVDVDVAAPGGDDVLYWNSATQKWMSKKLTDFSSDFKLNSLNDVDVSVNGSTLGAILYWNGVHWTQLYRGTEGQMLTVQGTSVVWKTYTPSTPWDDILTDGNYDVLVDMNGNVITI